MIQDRNYPEKGISKSDVDRRGFPKAAVAFGIAGSADLNGDRPQFGTHSQETAKRVQTVRGPIGAEQLGATLMHEHLFVLDPEIAENYLEE